MAIDKIKSDKKENTIGGRISLLREKNNMSQENLEEKTGIDRSLISKTEHNKRGLTDMELMSLSEELNVSIYYLLGMINVQKSNDECINAILSTKADGSKQIESFIENSARHFYDTYLSNYSPAQQNEFATRIYNILCPKK